MRLSSITTLLREAAELWIAQNAFQHAGALAFYTLFSLAPLVIILVAIVGVIFGPDAARGEIADAISGLVGTQAAGAVEEAVRRSQVEKAGVLPTLIGMGVLLFGATTVFAQIQGSLNQFWGVSAKPSRSGLLVFLKARLLSLGMVLIIGFLLLISFVVSIVLTAVIQYAQSWIPVPPVVVGGLDMMLSLMISTLLFAMMFKVLPDVQLQWQDVWRAALLTAVLFAVGQYVISLYLTLTALTSTYGAAGSLVVVLFWVYYSGLILFFGASLARVAILRRYGAVKPKRTAVAVETVVRETDEVQGEAGEGETE